MWVIISTINPEATTKIVKDARKNRRSEDVVNQNELVEVDPALYKEVKLSLKKVMQSSFNLNLF